VAWGAAVDKLGELQRLACPEPAARDRKTLARLTPRPPHWPQKGATKGELLAHIDRLELSHEAKAAAAKRVLAEFDRCRGGDDKPTS
jgi:hypothetical protein